jgi:hypothetical protein
VPLTFDLEVRSHGFELVERQSPLTLGVEELEAGDSRLAEFLERDGAIEIGIRGRNRLRDVE